MKQVLTVSVAAVISALSCFVISYSEGLSGRAFSFLGLPLLLVPIATGFICTGSLFFLLVGSLLKKNNRGITLSCFAVSLAFFLSIFAIPHPKVFKIGFRQRIKSSVSPDELRQIARSCQNALPINGLLPGPEKRSLWKEDEHRPLWNNLMNSTSIGKLDPWMVIIRRPDFVEISWGGALTGHWGLRIHSEPVAGEGDIAPGISTFTYAD